MAIQTTYSRDHAAGAEGAIASLEHNTNLISAVTDGTVAFGRVVTQASENICAAGGSDMILGISARHQSLPAEAGDVYPDQYPARIMNKGVIWVKVAANVAVGDAAAYLTADGQLVPSGTASSTDLTNASFISAAASGELAKVRLS